MNNNIIKTGRFLVWVTGRHGRPGEIIAEFEPEYFKSGKIKKTYKNVSIVETIREPYGFGLRSYSLIEEV